MLPHTYAWHYDSPLRRILAIEQPDLVEVCDKFWLLYLSGVLRRGWIAGVQVPVIVGLSCERLDDNMRAYVSNGRVAQSICDTKYAGVTFRVSTFTLPLRITLLKKFADCFPGG